MRIETTPEQDTLRETIRAYMAQLLTPALRAELVHQEGGGPEYFKAMEKLGVDGWLGRGWPVEHGGQGHSSIEAFIFFDEVHRSGFPIPLLTLNTVGPTLMTFGNEAQRAAFLPRILAGKCHFAIGYTEPDAGTDLASLKTRAVRDGDDYVINGQKIFCSLADFADYIWLAVRTDPDAAKHKGISMIVVPTDTPGLSTTPIRNLGDSNIHAVYLENVRVPVSNRVGPENGGWKMITTQLNHERVALMMVGPVLRHLQEARDWAAIEPVGDGRMLIELPWVQSCLARLYVKLDVLKLLNWRQAYNLNHNRLKMEEASGIKVFGSEFYVEAYKLLMEVFGEAGTLQAGSPGAALRGEIERHYRAMLVLTFGGGTNEVQRDIIAMAGLRMPRTRR
ncbi:MAG: alkylation response protein AidB-like acyl-CoA dehydrogenase [Myxococcota bacterium]|jgi:alkylation response protein AidB-like acyl-CoA dehydrogenase